MGIQIYRATELYNSRGRRGLFNVGKSHFYEVIEPQLERVALGERATGYTDQSVRKVIERGIKAAADRRRADVEAA